MTFKLYQHVCWCIQGSRKGFYHVAMTVYIFIYLDQTELHSETFASEIRAQVYVVH